MMANMFAWQPFCNASGHNTYFIWTNFIPNINGIPNILTLISYLCHLYSQDASMYIILINEHNAYTLGMLHYEVFITFTSKTTQLIINAYPQS